MGHMLQPVLRFQLQYWIQQHQILRDSLDPLDKVRLYRVDITQYLCLFHFVISFQMVHQALHPWPIRYEIAKHYESYYQ